MDTFQIPRKFLNGLLVMLPLFTKCAVNLLTEIHQKFG